MNLIEMRKYLETGFGAKHMATGRVFILLESVGIPAKHIGGLDKQNLVMVECYLEVVDGVLQEARPLLAGLGAFLAFEAGDPGSVQIEADAKFLGDYADEG